MKTLFSTALLLFISTISFSQKTNPDNWKFSVDYSSTNEATLVFKLKLDKDWHVYSQHTPDGGPLPMVYKFEPSPCYQLTGTCSEPVPHEEFDSTFELKVLIFDGEVTFRQKVKMNDAACTIKGTIEYQICKQACLSKDTSFVFNLRKTK
jgi:thiol:disulfide interchange protein DsbD